MKELILTLTMDKGHYEGAKNHYEKITSSIGDAAIFLLDTYTEMSEPRRKEHTDMYAIYIDGRKPETEEERRQLEKEVASGKLLKIHDEFTNTNNDWYISNEPLKHCYSKIDVVKDGKQVLSIGDHRPDDMEGIVSIDVFIGDKRYIIYADVGFDEDLGMYQIDSLDKHAGDYRTTVEDENSNYYLLPCESVPGIDNELWYAVLDKIVPYHGWSSDDTSPAKVDYRII